MKLRNPDKITIIAPDTEACAAVLGDAAVRTELSSDTLRLYLKADATPVKFIKLFWRFASNEIRRDGVKVWGDDWERGYGSMEWGPIDPFKRLKWACAVSNGSDANKDVSNRYTECFGIKVRPGAIVTWQYEQRGITLNADVRNGGSGVILGGRELLVCEIKFGEYRCMSAFQALKRFYKTLCDDPIFPSEPVYGSNNWYYAYGVSNRAQIIKDARLIAELTQGYTPRPYMVIDAGWNKDNMSGPWLGENPDYGDMKTLAQEIAALDVKPGIWIRYLCDEAGQWTDVPAEQRLSRNPKYLDPSHPRVLKLIAEDTARMSKQWGYKLIKHDFSNFDVFGGWGFERTYTITDDGWSFYDKSKTSAEIMVNMYKTIYEAAAPDTIIIGCNVAGFLTAGYAHINRAGDDTSGFDWVRTRRMGVNTVAFRNMHDGAFYKADCDCVGIMGKITWQLNRSWAELIACSGTPLFFSTDPDVVTDEEKRDVSAFLKQGTVQTDTAVPLDWMETSCPENWLINGKPVSYNWSADCL